MKKDNIDTKKQNSRKESSISRRHLLKALTAGTGAVVVGKSLPEKWSKPVVDSVLLPAHAQTSVLPVCHTRQFNISLIAFLGQFGPNAENDEFSLLVGGDQSGYPLIVTHSGERTCDGVNQVVGESAPDDNLTVTATGTVDTAAGSGINIDIDVAIGLNGWEGLYCTGTGKIVTNMNRIEGPEFGECDGAFIDFSYGLLIEFCCLNAGEAEKVADFFQDAWQGD